MIVDAGVHVWRAEPRPGAWPPGRESPQRDIPFEIEELLGLMSSNGVDRVVIVPPIWVGEDNADVLEWAARYPTRVAVMGRFDLRPGNIGALSTWLATPGMRGIRLSYPRQGFPDWLDLDSSRWFWDAAAEAAIPMFVLCQNQAARLAPIAAAYPGVPLIVDHLALRNVRVDRLEGRQTDPFERFDDLLALERYPNVSVKFSSLPIYSRERYPYADLTPGLRRALEVFGSERIMWASDFTRMSLLDEPPTYEEILAHVRDSLDFLSDRERADVLGGTALRVLNWPA